ncbi:thermonuclease family protein [Dongia soli]|uniref:thermonuclease family protein n=1 Tax=Dongia soli TaxID=600628 RepID=UPI002A6AEC9A|nr:thermonuclease family protein [Dongia soli]
MQQKLPKERAVTVAAQSVLAVGLTLALASSPALAKKKPADEPPAPKAAPVGAVDGAPLGAVSTTSIEGTPTVIDGDTLRFGDRLVRLYGIAAPDIDSAKGPDARVALDEIVDHQRVACTEADRTRDGMSIAICKAGNTDLAEAMLQRGEAAVYRAGNNATAEEQALGGRYDAAELVARQMAVGLWMKAEKPAAPPAKAEPAPEPWIDRGVIRDWIVAAPIVLLTFVGLLLLGLLGNRQRRLELLDQRRSDTSLLAQILAEVLAIREAAADFVINTSGLNHQAPLPVDHLATLNLPSTPVYVGNAGRAHRLPRDIGVDLVQFHAAHAGITQMLRHAGEIPSENVRTALRKLVDSADMVLERGQKFL